MKNLPWFSYQFDVFLFCESLVSGVPNAYSGLDVNMLAGVVAYPTRGAHGVVGVASSVWYVLIRPLYVC